MVIYNITVKVDAAIAAPWLQWIREEHIPDMLSTGCFTATRIVKLLEIDDSEGPTYAIQYTAESKADYNRYRERYASVIQQQSVDKWGNGFVAFGSLMEVIE